MLNVFKKVFGTKYDRDVKQYQGLIGEINNNFQSYQSLSNDQLRNKTHEFKQKIADYLSEIDEEIKSLKSNADSEQDLLAREEIFNKIDETYKERDEAIEEILKDILPEAFAVVKETARRFTQNSTIAVTATDHDRDLAGNSSYVTLNGDKAIWKNSWMAAGGEIIWNMIHYDVQLIGGMVLHDGKVAEMMTGEGKTLVATLPAYLNGLTGQGVHVITVNDYLARRDCEWIGPIFQFLFLTIDCIDKYKPHSPQRLDAYRSDIVYGTNNEFGFDYLRDNMVRSQGERVQHKHHYAMIDEVDSVLIDDARTPLIISGPVPQGSEEQEYYELKGKIEKLFSAQKQLATNYLAEAKKLIKEGSSGHEEGEGGLALLRAYRSLPKYRPLIKYLSEEGIKVTLQKSENFYMQEQSKNMYKVDVPLLFTIDEKNRNVELTENGVDFLSKGESDPSFFLMPDIAAEMQQLDDREKEEGVKFLDEREQLIQDFSVKSRRLHAVSQLVKAYTLFDKNEEYVVMDGQVKIVDEQTGRMMEGRRYSDGLHQALEAKENVKVGDITQTYATVTLQNYFRMYHKLAGMTGTAETEAKELWDIYKLDVVVIPTNRPIVRDDKEDMVYKTGREKYNAVIQEIEVLTGNKRPVLVGTTSVDISEKLSRMLQIKGIKHNVLNAKQHQREAEIVAEAGRPGNVTIATNMAGRGTDIKLSDEVKASGGLAIVATERHDSRRVDRQLRGRSGRQGDPGSSQFYVSLEDNLMRLFNSERIAKLMDKMGHQEGEVLQHNMVTKSIERAQKKVEENSFGVRKRLLEYDDVMNIQREAIYKKRTNALSGERLSVDLFNMFTSLAEAIAIDYKGVNDYDAFRNECIRVLAFDPDIDQAMYNEAPESELVDELQKQTLDYYSIKQGRIRDILLPIIKGVKENEGNRYKRIAIPFTDGRKRPLPISADLQEALDSKGKSIVKDIEKAVTLAIIDDNWKEHLRAMDELKESAQAASFEQKDPLVIYKMEAYDLFERLVYSINEDVSAYLMKGKLVFGGGEQIKEAKVQKTDLTKVKMSREEQAMRAAAEGVNQRPSKPETFKRVEKKVGRNEACPCGSGRKYKHCHGKN
ncbi:MAG: preprotein translocase subunit SecA [Saprospiraceae bacterium]|nr:preprotein translocase subunit SecA [Saprospiraceae bacterium]|tara:strand:- start:97 stop:3399 length:3303 start_codon:yes stop_codon:yes gene_type:complete